MLILAGIAAFAVAVPPINAQGPSVTGLWQKTEDGKPVGWFLFVEKNGVAEGAIAKLFPGRDDSPNPVCSKCSDDRKNAPLLGISLVRGMKREPQVSREGQVYKDGNILDPRDGQIWRAQMTVSPDGKKLTLRGYLLIPTLGKDEIWHRLPDSTIKELDRCRSSSRPRHAVPSRRPSNRLVTRQHRAHTDKTGPPR
jgi:hypothetical protein